VTGSRTAPRRRSPVGGARAFAEALEAAFDRAAARRGGAVARTYRIGDHAVRLRLAGPALDAPLTPAWRHLEGPGAPPALTVSAWDGASTGVGLPPAPWGADAYLPQGRIRGFDDGPVLAAHDAGTGILNVLDRERGRATWWTPDAAALPSWETGAPLRILVHWWVADRGLQLVHAAAVATAAGAALLVGRGGSGKSTTALACLRAGLGYLADDYCLVASDPPRVFSLYGTAKLDGAMLARFPELAGRVRNPDRPAGEKAVLVLPAAGAGGLRPAAPLRALVVPRVSGADPPRLRPAARAEALRALAPSTIFQLPGAGAGALGRLGAVVRALPAFVLELGPDLDAAAARVAEAIGPA
jgi:hypothetical protein